MNLRLRRVAAAGLIASVFMVGFSPLSRAQAKREADQLQQRLQNGAVA